MKVTIVKSSGKEITITGVAGLFVTNAGPVIVANEHSATEHRTAGARDLSIIDQAERWPLPDVMLGKISR